MSDAPLPAVPRRRHLLAALGAGCALAAPAALAQPWPARPLRLVVPYPTGGNADLLGRAIGSRLAEALGQPVIVENRGGAAGAIGAAAVAKAAPDGLTLLLGDIATHAINPLASPTLSYDPVRDFVPVARLTSVSLLVVAHPSLPATDPASLLALARSRPGRLTYASGGAGSPSHLAMEMLKAATGTFMLHVPYKGSGPALTDLAGGQTDLMIDGAAASFVKAGRLKLLGVTGDRSPAFPDAPPLSASVPGFRFESWHGLFAPAGTPADVVARLEAEVARALADPALAKRFLDLGITPVSAGSQAFGRFAADERERLARLVKSRGLSLAG
jgi:tripartite-type tricarboxylate transporter receptor subunit TctC